jgi:hypothetical protein
VLRFAMLLLVATISTAQAEQTEPRTLIGPIGFSCGKWTNAPIGTDERAQLEMWVTGYLSGLNMESSTDFLRDRDADGLTAWIDNYCRRNPLHAITQALHAPMMAPTPLSTPLPGGG